MLRLADGEADRRLAGREAPISSRSRTNGEREPVARELSGAITEGADWRVILYINQQRGRPPHRPHSIGGEVKTRLTIGVAACVKPIMAPLSCLPLEGERSPPEGRRDGVKARASALDSLRRRAPHPAPLRCATLPLQGRVKMRDPSSRRITPEFCRPKPQILPPKK